MVSIRTRFIRLLPVTAWFVALWLVALDGRAQTPDAAPAPPHLSAVEGTVSLERDARADQAVVDMPIVVGDRLKTMGGRAELLFADGSALAIDDSSVVDLQADTLIRLTAGHVVLTVAGADNPSAALGYQIDTPAGSAQTSGPGEFRITVFGGTPSQTEFDVLRGSGTLTNDRGSIALDAGMRSVALDDAAPSAAESFNSARLDDFDAWVTSERESRLGSSASAQYLPEDLQPYSGTFDQNGSWDYVQPYGYVWYPAVATSWRPYYNGYWSPIHRYGWTWVGLDAWSWPTHHFGRWGYASGAWFWVPSGVWSPAWVQWGAAPGYVSWCPLGYDGRPVFALSASVADAWHGWTVVPRNAFAYSYVQVAHNSVGPSQLHLETTPFIEQHVSPVAVPRHPIAVGVRVDAPSGQADGGARRTRPAPVAPPISRPAPVSRTPAVIPAPSRTAPPAAAEPAPAVPRGAPAAMPAAAPAVPRSAPAAAPAATVAPRPAPVVVAPPIAMPRSAPVSAPAASAVSRGAPVSMPTRVPEPSAPPTPAPHASPIAAPPAAAPRAAPAPAPPAPTPSAAPAKSRGGNAQGHAVARSKSS